MSGADLRFSIVCYPHDSMANVLALAEAADALGCHAFYSTDSNYRRDPWVVLGAAAERTKRVRLGPDVARLRVTDPLVVARALASLDELSGGRAEGGLGLGYAASLRARSKEGAEQPAPIPFLREAYQVIRTALSEPSLDFEGEHFRYQITDLPMMWQTVQKPLPLFYGSGGGPKATQLAGEMLDGLHFSGYKRATIEFGMEHLRRGAQKAGKDWRSMDIASTISIACSEDGDAAREVARVWATYYLGRTPPQAALRQELAELGLSGESLTEIARRWASGDIPGAVALMPNEVAALHVLGGTPDDIVAALRKNVLGTGVNHLVFGPVDAVNIRMLVGSAADSLRIEPAKRQLELLAKYVMPSLADKPATV